MKNFMEIYKAELGKVNALMGNSAFSRGISAYAVEITDNYNITFTGDETPDDLKKLCLNGARNWNHYAQGGCALAADYDIAARLCTKSELKTGRRPAPIVRALGNAAPWIDVEAEACEMAFNRIKKAFKRAKKEMEAENNG